MKRKNITRNALFTSVISLLLCVSMLVGTTFAWFTDSATSANNKIVAGNLDVELYKYDGTQYVNISESSDPVVGSDILWEPNHTQVVYLMIKNNGNLALKYTVGLNVQNVSKDLYEVMQYVITPDAQNGSVTSWDATNAKSVVAGTQTVTDAAVEMAPGAEHYFALSIHMDELAGNEYKSGEVIFDLTVLATQVNVESDSFGPDYDKDASVITVTPDTVQDALNNAADNTVIQLTAGNYDVLTLAPVYGSETTVLDSTTGNLSRSINGLTIKGADGAKVDGIKVSPMVGNTISLNNVVIDGVTFTGVAEGFLCNDGGATIKNFTMKNCTMTATGADRYDMVCIKSGTPENITITGCTVEGGLRLLAMTPSKNVTVTNNTISNVVEHGILLDNSGGRIHSGTIIVDNNYCYGANNRFIRFANMDDASVIITNNRVHQYKGGLDKNPYEDDYIKVTYKDANVTPNVTIYGNEVNCATGSGYPTRGDLYISVNDERFVQP